MIYAELKDIVRLIVIVFDRTSKPPKAYKEKAKTKKKDYCDNGDDNGSCDSDYRRDGNSNSESDEEGGSGSSDSSDKNKTLQVLMSMLYIIYYILYIIYYILYVIYYILYVIYYIFIICHYIVS